jgi:hypothetical protein
MKYLFSEVYMSSIVELQSPNHVISLATSAVLVNAEVSVWSATKQDRVISNEVTTAKKADHSAGRYVKNLLADDPTHKQLLNYRQTVYNWLRRNTYDWSGSLRLLPVINLPKFKAEFHQHEKSYFALRDAFLDRYPTIVSNMAFKQGDMFDRSEYPSVDQIKDKFRIRLYVAEVPTSDYRCAIADDLAEDLKITYQKQINDEIVPQVMADIASQFTEVMESISHCCGYDEIGTSADGEVKTKKRKIYEGTIEKARALCDTFRGFNLTNDADLAKASESLKNVLNGVDADALRESDAVRESVKSGVDDILTKFGSFKSIEV